MNPVYVFDMKMSLEVGNIDLEKSSKKIQIMGYKSCQSHQSSAKQDFECHFGSIHSLEDNTFKYRVSQKEMLINFFIKSPGDSAGGGED